MQTENLSPRKIRQRKLAQAVMEPGTDYTAVGEQLYPNTAYPRQTVYRSLQSPAVQAEMAKLAPVYYDETKLKQKLAEVLDTPSNQSVLVKAVELGMRSLAMLTDKQEQTQTVLSKRDDLGSIGTGELVAELVQRLKMSGAGLRIGQQSTDDAQGEEIKVDAT